MVQGSGKAVALASARASSPYQQYEGQRIADLSQNEQLGMTAARRNYGAFAEDYDRARTAAGSVGSVFNNQQFMGDMAHTRRSLASSEGSVLDNAAFQRDQGSARGALQSGAGSVFDNASFTGDMRDARGYIKGVGSITDQGALDGYMNPYLDEVLNPQVRRMNEAYGAETAELDRTAGMRGAFGGRRNVAEDMAAKRHQEGLGDLYGEAYSGAFDRATSLHQMEQDRKLQQGGALAGMAGMTASQFQAERDRDLARAGGYTDLSGQTSAAFQAEKDRALGRADGYTQLAGMTASNFQSEQDRKLDQSAAFTNIANAESQNNSQALRDLMQSGLVGRTRDQAELDFKYLEHLEKRDWNINNVMSLVDVLQRVPHESSTTGQSNTTSTETKSSSPLKTIAGIGAIAAGAIMTGGLSLATMGAVASSAGTGLLGGDE